MLCSAVLCCAVLCCAVLCCARPGSVYIYTENLVRVFVKRTKSPRITEETKKLRYIPPIHSNKTIAKTPNFLGETLERNLLKSKTRSNLANHLKLLVATFALLKWDEMNYQNKGTLGEKGKEKAHET